MSETHAFSDLDRYDAMDLMGAVLKAFQEQQFGTCARLLKIEPAIIDGMTFAEVGEAMGVRLARLAAHAGLTWEA